MAEEGRALLRNFRLRQQLKLLPRNQPIGIGTAGAAGTAGTVSLKRLEELLSHRAFGYESENFESFEAANVPSSDARSTLQEQLQDLNATKAAEMLQFQEVELAAQSLQQEMTKMVDEHEALARQRYELWARQKELADETLRVQAVLADLDSDAQVKNDQPRETDGNRSLEKTAERLKLHHLHLQRLLAEQKLLQQQLGAEHMADMAQR